MLRSTGRSGTCLNNTILNCSCNCGCRRSQLHPHTDTETIEPTAQRKTRANVGTPTEMHGLCFSANHVDESNQILSPPTLGLSQLEEKPQRRQTESKDLLEHESPCIAVQGPRSKAASARCTGGRGQRRLQMAVPPPAPPASPSLERKQILHRV